ncbi:hypothetical protein CCAX7_32320 [Capsulimonas corticalis]|uniref:Uncharacterized protein n=1 Tax=Capsulimonas corticalis TaxID=2219043 RepID=A0A402D406_9BACT|nr:helicase-related protein [Capsulimonas corticalis]BDI31181.1 hypothetical protein CCAX7_32320 [Capsulimonas corticalis]
MSNYKVRYGSNKKPISGVGRGIGLCFVKAYFPIAKSIIRITSGYFRLSGYEQSRSSLRANVQLQILVGNDQGENTIPVFVNEILLELGRSLSPLSETVADLLKRIEAKHFIIRGAWETNTPRLFHCKYYIIDDKIIWHGSTNFTKQGLGSAGNHEQASVLSSRDTQQFIEHFDETITNSYDLIEALQLCLKTWLEMASPFQAYLKFLQFAYEREVPLLGPGGYIPTYFQKGIINSSEQQINKYKGSIVLAATGLGKTIIGSEIIRRVTNRDSLAIILGPKSVKSAWEAQLRSRNINFEYFDTSLLFKKQSHNRLHQINTLLKFLEQSNKNSVLVIDEAHVYRKMLQKDANIQRQNTKGVEAKINIVRERIDKFHNTGGSVLLLTATPYGTDRQDLNSLLRMLPLYPQKDNLFHDSDHWKVNSLSEVKNLPIVSILGIITLLKMAISRKDVEEDGRIFISMPDRQSNRYFPSKIVLHRTEYSLFLQEDIQHAFENQVFKADRIPFDVFNEQKDKNELIAADVSSNNAILAWTGSVDMMLYFISRCRNNAPDNTHKKDEQVQMQIFNNEELSIPLSSETVSDFYRTNYTHSEEFRKNILNPIVDGLNKINLETEEKFVKLKNIIQTHIEQKEKAIIFTKRHLTAMSIHKLLENNFPFTKIACTVQKENNKHTIKSLTNRKNIIEHFSPRSSGVSDIQHEQEYNILICTDADGIGLNMQDANIIINYDLPQSADELFQRAGRVLRMTEERNRAIHIYTFEPTLHNKETQAAKIIKRMISRLHERHDNSRSLIGRSILPNADGQNSDYTISLATESDIAAYPENLILPEELLQDTSPSFLNHMSIFKKYQSEISELPTTLFTAKSTTSHKHSILALLEYQAGYYVILYDIDTKTVKEIDISASLDLINCGYDEPKSLISPLSIEEEAISAVQCWLNSNHYNPELCTRICSVYLKPKEQQSHELKKMIEEIA